VRPAGGRRRALAGWRRIPSPSATASGSPNRLLCPNPVRYMSVISGSVEPTIAYCGCLRRRLERIADAGPEGCSRRSAWHKRTQHWPEGKSRPGVRIQRAHICLLERAVCRPLAPAGSTNGDKIPNHRADLLILRVVTGGRCWVRTNVGLADGYRPSILPIGTAADLRILYSSPRENRDLSVWRP
jgi:hypothetical protein